MRALLLSQWYPPEPDIKSHLIARGLAARGHRVTSITGFPNYPSGELYDGYRLRVRQVETLDGVRVVRVPLYPDHGRALVPRIANYASFALASSTVGLAFSGPADVMWIYQGPLTIGVPTLAISAARRIPFVLGIHDVWPEILAATGMLRSRAAARLAAGFARALYERASAISVISPGFKRNLVAKGVPAEKIHVIPDWVDESIYRPVERDNELAAQLGFAGQFVALYAGNMGPAQDVENVVRAAAFLRGERDIVFALAGDGVDEPRLRELARELKLENLMFLGRQSAARMPDLFAISDALLVTLKRDPYYEIAIPSKVVAYLAGGRPIVCATAGESASLVLSSGAGVACAAGDPRALAEAVRRLRDEPAQSREAMGNAGRRLYLASYTNRGLLDAYENLLMRVAGEIR